MSTEKHDESVISTALVKRSGKPTPGTLNGPGGSSNEVSAEGRDSKPLTSRIREHFENHEARLEWDNDLALCLARNVIWLRRTRCLTQAELAERVGTSQARIATIEGAGGNVTVRTIERLAEALNGRINFSMEPAERVQPRLPSWWTFELPQLDLTWDKPLLGVVSHERANIYVAGWVAKRDSGMLLDEQESEVRLLVSGSFPHESDEPGHLAREFEIA